MADNYLKFSELLPIKGTPEYQQQQLDWLDRQLSVVVGYWSDDRPGEQIYFAEDGVPGKYDSHDPSYLGPWFLVDYTGLDKETEPCMGFCVRSASDHGDVARAVVVFAEEYGEPNKVAWLVQKFLKKFDSHAVWTLEYSVTCSKPRVGEFGGGGVAVTADEQHWFDTGQVVQAKARELLPWGGSMSMMEVEYWRCWPGNGDDLGQWDTDCICIPRNIPEDRYDAAVQEAVKQARWKDNEPPCFVGFYAKCDDLEEENDDD